VLLKEQMEADYKFFKDNKEQLEKDYNNRCLVIKDCEVVRNYDNMHTVKSINYTDIKKIKDELKINDQKMALNHIWALQDVIRADREIIVKAVNKVKELNEEKENYRKQIVILNNNVKLADI
jgi:hypothetical protein